MQLYFESLYGFVINHDTIKGCRFCAHRHRHSKQKFMGSFWLYQSASWLFEPIWQKTALANSKHLPKIPKYLAKNSSNVIETTTKLNVKFTVCKNGISYVGCGYLGTLILILYWFRDLNQPSFFRKDSLSKVTREGLTQCGNVNILRSGQYKIGVCVCAYIQKYYYILISFKKISIKGNDNL